MFEEKPYPTSYCKAHATDGSGRREQKPGRNK
jgi:hypothetical protein